MDSNSIADSHLSVGSSKDLGCDIVGWIADWDSYSLNCILRAFLLDSGKTSDTLAPCWWVSSKSCCPFRSCSEVLGAAATEEVLHFLSSFVAQMLLMKGWMMCSAKLAGKEWSSEFYRGNELLRVKSVTQQEWRAQEDSACLLLKVGSCCSEWNCLTY